MAKVLLLGRALAVFGGLANNKAEIFFCFICFCVIFVDLVPILFVFPFSSALLGLIVLFFVAKKRTKSYYVCIR